jgi:hypothetical protein
MDENNSRMRSLSCGLAVKFVDRMTLRKKLAGNRFDLGPVPFQRLTSVGARRERLREERLLDRFV